MRKLVAGNWKMNGLASSLDQLAALKDGLGRTPPACDVLVCPPATLIAQAALAIKGAFALGAQDCHAQPKGAFTGDISAEMLKDAGASHVIVGHSERRQYHGETSAQVALKAQAAWRAGLRAIICIGESLEERKAGNANHICQSQLKDSVPEGAAAANTVIAYEPVWAIGTGRNATSAQAGEAHAHIRTRLRQWFGGDAADTCRVIYGGSVKPDNIRELIAEPDVDGALVGGASLEVKSFADIVKSSRSAK
ncbi:MAG TPA: triose-phosphate isomerase [Rhizomicrobium sp.]|nr:triose-phosphate isomerase [Rhizomicrobium sp.]